jgi:hypothetical protein
MEESRFTYQGRRTFKGERGDVGVLLGAADQDFDQTVVLDVGGTLKSVASRIGRRAVREGDIGSRWELVAYKKVKNQLRRLNS